MATSGTNSSASASPMSRIMMKVDNENLAERIRDNPAGQDDELTPFIIIRDIGDAEAEEFVPLVAIDEPTH